MVRNGSYATLTVKESWHWQRDTWGNSPGQTWPMRSCVGRVDTPLIPGNGSGGLIIISPIPDYCLITSSLLCVAVWRNRYIVVSSYYTCVWGEKSYKNMMSWGRVEGFDTYIQINWFLQTAPETRQTHILGIGVEGSVCFVVVLSWRKWVLPSTYPGQTTWPP